MTQAIYGILDRNQCHIDVSNSLLGAKQYATRNGYGVVSMRYEYNVTVIAYKKNDKWISEYDVIKTLNNNQ